MIQMIRFEYDAKGMIMLVSINYRDPRPIYEQVKDQLRRLIISGAVKPEEKLPSVRDLAQKLAINPNTIQRAYRELESEGYIYSVPGKGSFVGERREFDKGRIESLLRSIDEAVIELGFLGVSAEELCRRIKEANEDDKG
jgi:Predicted transcriptional regulators